MHASKNSGTSRTFRPFKEECHPMTTVAICPFGPSFFVACQRICLKLGNGDVRKIFFGDRPYEGPFELSLCFVGPVPSFGADNGEYNPYAETKCQPPRQRGRRRYV